MKEGNKALRADDYDTALLEYQAGARIESASVFFYDLGQSYRLAGRYKEAIRQYTLFLHRGQPGKVLRDLVDCHVRMMKAELDRAAMTEPPVDPPPENRSSAASTTTQEQVHDIGAAATLPERPSPWYADRTGWGIAGVGTVATTVGVMLFVNAADLDDQASVEDRENARAELLDKADSRRTWGTAVTIAGAAALVGGVVKLALTPDPPRHDRGARLDVGPGYVGLIARF